jgi:hypothetical protein
VCLVALVLYFSWLLPGTLMDIGSSIWWGAMKEYTITFLENSLQGFFPPSRSSSAHTPQNVTVPKVSVSPLPSKKWYVPCTQVALGGRNCYTHVGKGGELYHGQTPGGQYLPRHVGGSLYMGRDIDGDFDFDEDDVLEMMRKRLQLNLSECAFYVDTGKNSAEKKRRKVEIVLYESWPRTRC